MIKSGIAVEIDFSSERRLRYEGIGMKASQLELIVVITCQHELLHDLQQRVRGQFRVIHRDHRVIVRDLS